MNSNATIAKIYESTVRGVERGKPNANNFNGVAL
jgi:hypothetical protein